MTAKIETRTIDVTGLGHAEKEERILGAIESLASGDRLRIIIEFNPVPLVHLFRARGGLAAEYEKEGTPSRVLNVTRTGGATDPRKTQFKQLLQELRSGRVAPETREKARRLLSEVDIRQPWVCWNKN